MSSDGSIVVANILNDLWQKTNDDNVEAWFELSGQALNVAVFNQTSRYIIDTSRHVKFSQ